MTCHLCAKTNCIGECEPKQAPLAWKHYTKPLERRLQHLEAKENQNSFDKHEASALRHVLGIVTQPQRTWVGLTDEEYFEIGQRHWLPSNKVEQIHKEIEAKLKEKNA